MALNIPIAERRVGREGLPAIQQQRSVSAGGQEVAQAITQLGGVVEKIGEQIERKEVAENKALLQAQKEALELQERKDKMYSDATTLEYRQKWSDEKDKFLGVQRLNADGISKKFTDWYAKTSSTLIGKGTNPRQKELIRASLDTEFTANYEKVKDHESNQLRLTEKELKQSLFDNAKNTAGSPDSNALDILNEELTARDALDELYKDHDPASKDKLKAEGISSFHESVVNGKLINDLDFAKKYFKEAKGEILPGPREELRKSIHEQDVRQTSIKIADKVSDTEKDSANWVQRVDILTKDEEIRDKAKEILKARKKDADAHDAELTKREFTDTLDLVIKANNLEDGIAKANTIQDPENRLKAINVANSIHERKKRDVETDFKVWADVKDRIHAGEFKNTTELLEFFPSFSASDFKVLSNELDAYLTEQKSGKKVDDGAIKHSTLKDAFSVALGVKYDVEDTDQMRDFRYAYDKLREKNITDFGEAKDEIRKLILDGEIFGGEKFQLWEPDMTRAEAEATGQLDKWMPNILDEDVDSGAERQSIINALSQDGITDPGDTLMRLYKKDSILNLPLSDGQKALYRRLWKKSRSKK